MSSISVICLVLGLVIGAAVVYIMLRGRFQSWESAMRERLQTQEADSQAKQTKLNELLPLEGEIRHLRESLQQRMTEIEETARQRDEAREQRGHLQTELEASSREINEKEASLKRDRERFLEEKEQLENAFANLSKQALSQAQNTFLEIAKEKFADERKVSQKEIDEVLAPMKQTLEQLRVHTSEIEEKRTSSYAELSSQVRSLLDSTTKLGNALQRPEVRGSWGELTLRRAAEHAGLVEGTDFEMQVNTSTEEGRFRPDMVVRLSNNRVIVVDAKTPLHAYLAANEAQDPVEKGLRLKEHASQVRKHIMQLSTKSYQGLYADTADFVVMFVPSESLYQVAIQEDPALLDEAFNRKVILANPMTLVALLKTIANGMQQQKAYENALQIAKLGGELHDSVSVFAEHYTGVGQALERAVKKYNEGSRSIERNVVSKARRMKELGLKTQRQLEESNQLAVVVEPNSLPVANKTPEPEAETLF